jgi:predicted transcriptional regulator
VGTLTTAQVLRAVSDDKSMNLFRLISLDNKGADSELLKLQSRLSRKQFYSRLERLMKAGLIRRRKGRYSVTFFGKIVNHSHSRIDYALANLWKLKEIDSLETSNELPKEERQKLIDGVFTDKKDPNGVPENKIKYPSEA